MERQSLLRTCPENDTNDRAQVDVSDMQHPIEYMPIFHHVRPSMISKMPPMTNRGWCRCDDADGDVCDDEDDATAVWSCSDGLRSQRWASKSIGARMGSTGRGSIRLSPWRSIESWSQRDRSSLKASSTADGRRRRNRSDERPRRTERKVNGLWLRLREEV